MDETWNVKQLCYTTRNEKTMRVCCVRWGVLSSLTVACTTFAYVCKRLFFLTKTANVQDSRKRCNGSERLRLPLLPPLLILSFFLFSFLPLLRFFPLLRIPPRRWRWRWWRPRLCSTDIDSIAGIRLAVESLIANQWVFVGFFVVEEWRRFLVLSKQWLHLISLYLQKIFVNPHVTRVCRVLPFQCKVIFVSVSFSTSSSAGYRDLREVVQEHALFERPSMFLLSVSEGRLVAPPSCNRSILSFLVIFCSVHGFPVVVLPLLISMALSLFSSLDFEKRICKDDYSSFIFVCVFLRGYQTQTASAVNCCFFGTFHANKTELFWLIRWVHTNRCCPSLLARALIPRWTHWTRLLVSSLWWWTCRDIRLAVCQPNVASGSSAPRLCWCRLVILHGLEDRLETSLLLSQHGLGLEPRTVSRQQFPATPSGQRCELLLDSVLPPISRGCFDSKTTCCCCSWKALLRTIRGASLGVEERWSKVISPRCEITRQYSQVARAVCDDWMQFVPKRYAFFLCSPERGRINSVLRLLLSCFVVNLSGFHTLLLLRYTMVQWCEEYCGVWFLVLLRWVQPSIWTSDWMNILCGIQTVTNCEVWRRGWLSISGSKISPPVSSSGSNVQVARFWKCWNIVLLLPFQMNLIQSLPLKLLPPSRWNLNLSFGIMNFQWISNEFPMKYVICLPFSRMFTSLLTIFETWISHLYP